MSRVICAIFAASAALAAGCARAPSASATKDYQYDWSGNTQSGVTTKLTTNFAVLDTTKATDGDSWATGYARFDASFSPGRDFEGNPSPGLDTSALYLYLYQDVNDTDSGSEADSSQLQILQGVYQQITSWGSFQGVGFADAEGDVNAGNVFGENDHTTDPGAPHVGVDLPKVISIIGAEGGTSPGVSPSSVVLNPDWFIRNYASPPLQPGQRATLVGFTTNLPPTTAANQVNPDPNEPPPAVPADPGTITEGSPIALGVLKLVNLVTADYLANTVGVSPGAAGRIGAHAQFTQLAQLLPLVDQADFQILVDFAEQNGYVAPPAP